jgi:putative hydrolase of the HAD superfamily
MILKMRRSIHAITFDVGGTLIEPWPSVGHVYASVATKHGICNLSPDLLNERFHLAWNKSSEFAYTRSAWKDIVAQTFSGLAPSTVPFFDELYERFSAPDAWRIFDDARPSLERLKSLGVRCAVVSNWDERLRALLQRLNLDHYFDVLVISCEVGAMKPDPRIFEAAAARFGIAPASILHVGDSRTRDVEGAVAAGFRAVRIRRAGAGPAGAGELGLLTELASLVSAN